MILFSDPDPTCKERLHIESLERFLLSEIGPFLPFDSLPQMSSLVPLVHAHQIGSNLANVFYIAYSHPRVPLCFILYRHIIIRHAVHLGSPGSLIVSCVCICVLSEHLTIAILSPLMNLTNSTLPAVLNLKNWGKKVRARGSRVLVCCWPDLGATLFISRPRGEFFLPPTYLPTLFPLLGLAGASAKQIILSISLSSCVHPIGFNHFSVWTVPDNLSIEFLHSHSHDLSA